MTTGLAGDDTIAAMATLPGRGALAIVRVSGPRAHTIADQVLDRPLADPRRAAHRRVLDASGATLDDVVAVRYTAPHSFTGEDMLELTTHGGLVVPVTVLAAVLEAGARQAEPGEFTRRAVLNGKLDLLQAEAIGDLIDARSQAAQRAALRQLDGGLSRRVLELRRRILEVEALIAYDIDFPEEDDGPIPRERVSRAVADLESALTMLLATSEQGAVVHEGALVVLAGAPNVGKSALFNALLGEARAIVTEIPGTTRDAIEAVLDLPGWPLRLVDTAGLRETDDVVEQLGIDTAGRYLDRASVILACGDTPAALEEVTRALASRGSGQVVRVATKRDLVANSDNIAADVGVSAETGEGLRALLEIVESRLADTLGAWALDAPALTRARHRAAVAQARDEVAMFATAWREEALPASVAAVHMRAAAGALEELIGGIHVDDVLDVVFASFCVGK